MIAESFTQLYIRFSILHNFLLERTRHMINDSIQRSLSRGLLVTSLCILTHTNILPHEAEHPCYISLCLQAGHIYLSIYLSLSIYIQVDIIQLTSYNVLLLSIYIYIYIYYRQILQLLFLLYFCPSPGRSPQGQVGIGL